MYLLVLEFTAENCNFDNLLILQLDATNTSENAVISPQKCFNSKIFFAVQNILHTMRTTLLTNFAHTEVLW